MDARALWESVKGKWRVCERQRVERVCVGEQSVEKRDRQTDSRGAETRREAEKSRRTGCERERGNKWRESQMDGQKQHKVEIDRERQTQSGTHRGESELWSE